MEEFQLLRDRAIEKVKIADHMLFMTYPMVKDPRLLLAVLENIYSSLDYGMSALLQYEKLFKTIGPYQDNFNSKFEIFNTKLVPKHNLNQTYIKLIREVRTIVHEHKQSPVEFAKKDKFVICSPTYNMKTVDAALAKRYIFETKLFVSTIDRIVKKNEGIFTGSKR